MTDLVATHHQQHVLPYYQRLGSRLGYAALLNRTRHFGWYEPTHSPWRFTAAMRRMEVVVARRLALPPGSAVLDAGCGVGDVARTVARVSGAQVTGIDGIASDVGIARHRSARADGPGTRTRFLTADYHALPFADASYDGVYTMESCVHSPDPQRVLTELHRVLRPGGRLVMCEYSSTPTDHLAPGARSALNRVCALSAMPGMLALTHGELDRLLRRTGFTLDSAFDATEKILPMLRAFAVLGRLPYSLACRVNREDSLVNAMSGVEMYRHQDAWRYVITVATKP
ncbi:class I SAM-dependent methyltransferase [Streptomyces flavofungini]|uniref:class I SAM-dependent methyltransferase n=1 Tax=Streptomyces flavofungini TaxID=68200 RepID=UPI0034E02BFE